MNGPSNVNIECKFCYAPIVPAREQPVALQACQHKVHHLCAETLLLGNDKRCPVEGCGRLAYSYKITLICKHLEGFTTIIHVDPNASIEELKSTYCYEKDNYSLARVNSLNMIFDKRLLDNANRLSHYNIRNGSVIACTHNF